MADLFDRFAGSGALSAHTADSGDAWDSDGAGFSLTGSAVHSTQASPTNGAVPFSSWTPPGTDYSVSAVIGADLLSSAGVVNYGPLVRGTGSSGAKSYYVLVLNKPGASYDFSVYRIVSGDAGTQVGTTQAFSSLSAGDTITLAVSGTGATVTLTVSQNGAQLYTIGDTNAARLVTAGAAGLWVLGTDPAVNDIFRTLWAGAIGGPSEGVTPALPSVALSTTQSLAATGDLPNETLNWTATHGTITGSPGVAVTYTAPATGSSDSVAWTSVDLPTHTATASITLIEGTIALTGPTTGTTGSASTNFTVTATALTGSDTVTCHSDSGGTFTTSPLSFSSGSGSHTFTYTAAADGAHAISITDSLGAVITGSPITFTSSTPSPTPTPPPTHHRSRKGPNAIRRAKELAGLVITPSKPPPIVVSKPPAPAPPVQRMQIEPLRPAISDARPSKAKLDFPLR